MKFIHSWINPMFIAVFRSLSREPDFYWGSHSRLNNYMAPEPVKPQKTEAGSQVFLEEAGAGAGKKPKTAFGSRNPEPRAGSRWKKVPPPQHWFNVLQRYQNHIIENSTRNMNVFFLHKYQYRPSQIQMYIVYQKPGLKASF